MSLGLALAAGGALLGGLGGSSSPQTSSTSVPEWMKPYLIGENGVLTGAQDLYEQGPADYYGGDTVADLTGGQVSGIDLGINTANTSMLPNAGNDLALKTINGDFLGGNQFMDAYGNDILDSVTSRFGMAGRSGSALEGNAATKELGDVASRLYQGERQNQINTLGMMPSIEAARYMPADQLLNYGGMQQNQNQAEINADIERYNYNANAEQQHLQDYANLVYGAPSGSKTTTSQVRNPLLGAIGGGLAGYSYANQFAK